MALFGRRKAATLAPSRYLAPRTGDTFLVSGVTFRQQALQMAGVSNHVFRLVREPTNPHDRNAVAVYCGAQHIGYISAKIASRYGEAVARVEAHGSELCVHGAISRAGRADPGLIASIDCPWPEDI